MIKYLHNFKRGDYMSKNDSEKETLEALIAQINELLYEIKEEQQNLQRTMENNHKVNMQKFSRILEFNEICDMTNSIFEKRISSIDKLLYDVFKS